MEPWIVVLLVNLVVTGGGAVYTWISNGQRASAADIRSLEKRVAELELWKAEQAERSKHTPTSDELRKLDERITAVDASAASDADVTALERRMIELEKRDVEQTETLRHLPKATEVSDLGKLLIEVRAELKGTGTLLTATNMRLERLEDYHARERDRRE